MCNNKQNNFLLVHSRPIITLGVRLRQIREKNGLTQEKLARKAGITQQAVQRIEAGKAKRTKFLTCIAQILNVAPEWLENGDFFKTESLAMHPIQMIPTFSWEIAQTWLQRKQNRPSPIAKIPTNIPLSKESFGLFLKDSPLIHKSNFFSASDIILIEPTFDPMQNLIKEKWVLIAEPRLDLIRYSLNEIKRAKLSVYGIVAARLSFFD